METVSYNLVIITHFVGVKLVTDYIITTINVYSCCGAGTAADTEMTTQMIASQLELHKLNTGRTPRVATANRLLKQMLFRYRQNFLILQTYSFQKKYLGLRNVCINES